MDSPKSICVNCRRFESVSGGPRTGIWYNLYCHAVTRYKGIDPVSGEEGYIETNSFGQRYFTDQRFSYCRDINPNGDCVLFTPNISTLQKAYEQTKEFIEARRKSIDDEIKRLGDKYDV